MLNKFLKHQKAFSLTELIIVVIIIGLVVAIGLPGINKARADAETEAMRAKAIAIQNAKLSFITSVGHETAAARWATAASDQVRYRNFLYQYLPATYPTTLSCDPTQGPSVFPSSSGFFASLDGGAYDPSADEWIDNTHNIDISAGLSTIDPAGGNNINVPLQKY